MPVRPVPLLTLLAALGLPGCESMLDTRYADSVPPTRGVERIQGLGEGASVRRNALGMPLIEANNFHDALFTMGYVHAGDRLSQMVGMRLLAEGRLAEMLGPGVLDIDRFMRTVNLKASAAVLYQDASPRLKQFFEVYARGVNAYLYRYRDRLPMDLAQAGYQPEYWKPEDCALLYALVNFSLSVNLQEEIAALVLAQKVGADKLAWLLPVYPDEPLPFDDTAKLSGLSLAGQIPGLSSLQAQAASVAALESVGVAASNNWAIAPPLAKGRRSLFANDAHLPLSQPSLWNFMQIRSPKFQAAGITVAGIPAVVAGFNGKLAWGMTMVMGDNQDLFLEQVRRDNGRPVYLADGKWLPMKERQETFLVKGGRPVRETIYETRNGPLLNGALGARKDALQPLPASSAYGLALKTAALEPDQSLDAFFDLSRAQSVNAAFDAAREIRASALNLVFADAQHIGWQVTGRYPNRREGRGLVPSPGWDSRYAWDGYAEPMLHPYDQDPPQNRLGTANQRTVQGGYGVQLSSSWYYPERAERLAQLAARPQQDYQTMIGMQYDQSTPFAGKLKAMLEDPAIASPLSRAIAAMPAAERGRAQEVLASLRTFDGRMSADSAGAAIYATFLQQSARQIFGDELGAENEAAWQALVQAGDLSYSAQADHLLGRVDSPFWDDIHTPQVEDKPAILARSLASTATALESRLGTDRHTWAWGKLHAYRWTSDNTRLAPYLPAGQRNAVAALGEYLDRGPHPAGGDHGTLNAAAYHWGGSDDVWLAPSMRIVVDFGLQEPMMAVNGSGQSGNPASPHYADGIQNWLNAQYMTFPFQPGNLDRAYGTERLTLLPAK